MTLQPTDWLAYTERYSWARNPYQDLNYQWMDYSDSYVTTMKSSNSLGTYAFNQCGTLAKWMIDKGWRVDTAPTLHTTEPIKSTEIQKGDVIFFSEYSIINNITNYFAQNLRGYNYRNITHAGIVVDVKVRSDLIGTYNPYGYFITIVSPPSLMQAFVNSTSSNYEYSSQMINTLASSNTYTNGQGVEYHFPAIDTISIIARPDLSSSGGQIDNGLNKEYEDGK